MAFKPSLPLTRIIGLFLFLGLGIGMEWQLYRHGQERADQERAASILTAEKFRARLEAELNAVALTSITLADHWTARHAMPDAKETRKILANAFRNGRHVRSFAIVVGTRIAQVFPQDDDVHMTGLDYQQQPRLWPWIQRCIETRNPLLGSSLSPGHEIEYCVPIFVAGQFWGLLITSVDNASLLSAVGLSQNGGEYLYALRATKESGMDGGMILGAAELFHDPNAYITEATALGGGLRLVVKPSTPTDSADWVMILRGLAWLFSALFAVQTITLLKLRRRLSDLALFDALTGLPGRHLFLDRLKQTIRRTKRNRGNLSVLFVNLDDFKSINANHSVRVGDMMLAGIGKRLLSSIRHCDTVTRWSGNEFLVLLDACPMDQASLIAENLRHKIELPVSYGDNELRIPASIGVATYPEDGHSFAALLKIADARMRLDKNRHKASNPLPE